MIETCHVHYSLSSLYVGQVLFCVNNKCQKSSGFRMCVWIPLAPQVPLWYQAQGTNTHAVYNSMQGFEPRLTNGLLLMMIRCLLLSPQQSLPRPALCRRLSTAYM